MKPRAVYNSIPDAIGTIKSNGYRLIGIVGGSCSGKTYFANLLAKKLHGSCMSMDDYYIGRSRMKDDNFDHPDAIDLKLWCVHLEKVRKGDAIERPVYNFITHEREGTKRWQPTFPVIAEGLFVLLKPQVNKLDLKIFLEADSAIRLSRRISRDTTLRQRTQNDVKTQWYTHVEHMHNLYVAPQNDIADIIVYNNKRM